jgi:hypothetical protein
VRGHHKRPLPFCSLQPDQEIAVTIPFECQRVLFADLFDFVPHGMLVIRHGGMLHQTAREFTEES